MNFKVRGYRCSPKRYNTQEAEWLPNSSRRSRRWRIGSIGTSTRLEITEAKLNERQDGPLQIAEPDFCRRLDAFDLDLSQRLRNQARYLFSRLVRRPPNLRLAAPALPSAS